MVWIAFKNSLLLVFGLLATGPQFAACTTVQARDVRSNPPSIEQDDALAIVVSYEARNLESEEDT